MGPENVAAAFGGRRSLLRFATHSSAYVATLGIQALGAALVLPLLTRLLPVAAFGTASAVLIAGQIGSVVATLGMPAAVGRTYFDGPEGPAASRRLLGWSAAVTASLLLPSGVLLILATEWSDVALIGFAGFSIVGLGWMWLVQSYLRASQAPTKFAVVTVLGSIGAQAVGAAAAAVSPTATAYLAGVVATQLVAGGFGLAMTLAWSRRSTVLGLPAALRYGLPTVPHLLAAYVLAASDRFVIAAELGAAAVGEYQVAYLLGNMGIAVLGAVNSAWAPVIFSRIASGEWKRFLERTAGAFVSLGAGLTVLLALLAPVGLRILAPGSFITDRSRDVVAIVALSAIPFAIYLSAAHVLFVSRRTAAIASTSVTAATLNVLLNLLLVPAFGLTAAAYSTLVAYVVQAALIRLRAARIARLRLLPLWTVAPISLASIVVALAVTTTH